MYYRFSVDQLAQDQWIIGSRAARVADNDSASTAFVPVSTRVDIPVPTLCHNSPEKTAYLGSRRIDQRLDYAS